MPRQRLIASAGGPLRERRRSTSVCGGRLPLRPFQQAPRRRELVERRVAQLPPGDHDELVGGARARDRLLVGPGLALRQHVHLAVLVGEPGRDGLPLAAHIRANPDHVGLLEAFLDALVEGRWLGLHVHRDLDLAEHLVVDHERCDVHAGLLEHRALDVVDLGREVEHPRHPPILGTPAEHHPSRGSEEADLFLHDPDGHLPGAEHHERQRGPGLTGQVDAVGRDVALGLPDASVDDGRGDQLTRDQLRHGAKDTGRPRLTRCGRATTAAPRARRARGARRRRSTSL